MLPDEGLEQRAQLSGVQTPDPQKLRRNKHVRC